MTGACQDNVLRVRTAQAGDAGWLAACAIAMAHETEHKALDPATVRAGIEAGLADPVKARYFVAMYDVRAGTDTLGMPAGTLMLTREWSDWRNGDWWWIQSVYVMPQFRKRGVFAALYRHVEGLARAAPGVVGLRLYVERDNAGARATYTRLGMRDTGYSILEAASPRDPE
jgi:ribosomal protein S18 acetylase RimI-like enzyme